jgi:hypothetical protein
VLAQKPDIVRRLLDLGVSPHIGTDQRYTCAPHPRLYVCVRACVCHTSADLWPRPHNYYSSMGSPLELAHKQPGQKGKAILQMLQGRAEGEEETLKRKSVAYNDPASITRYLNASTDRISCESTYLAVCRVFCVSCCCSPAYYFFSIGWACSTSLHLRNAQQLQDAT